MAKQPSRKFVGCGSLVKGRPEDGRRCEEIATTARTRYDSSRRRTVGTPTKMIRERARRVRAIVLDVDGVLTDAGLYFSARGESLKRFSARDGFAIKLAQGEGIPVGILSGRVSPPLRARLAALDIDDRLVIQGSQEKGAGLRELCERLGVGCEAVAFMGDDLPDLPALAAAGLSACPADAVPEVLQRCDVVCKAAGGRGVVRELVELVLTARGRWEQIVADWVSGRATLRIDKPVPDRRRDER
jgi:3-deoxy-D-manno-octulosonate 8-phosphate phosphatase (KDO 8-P phosphatase)